MRPQRTIALALVLFLTMACSNVSPAGAQDKQRVPKQEKKPRYKPDPPSGGTAGQTSSDDEDGSSCLADCLGSFFASLFSSPTPPPPAQVALVPWTVGEPGRLLGAAEADSVWLWDGPGGADRDRAQVARLPSGAPVVILETHSLPNGAWLRVRPVHQAEPVGWIAAASLTELEPEPGTGPPTPADQASPKPARRPPTWGVMLAAGGGGPGPSDLDQEYADGGFRIEAQYLRYLPRNWQSGAGVGWRNYAGNPRVIYAYSGSPLVEEPSDSRLQILDMGIRAGTRHGRDTGFQFSWLLGPALYYVHEHAQVRVIDSSSGFQVDAFRDELGRWAGGGDLRLNFGALTPQGLEVGVLVDGFIMAWTGQQERSLTTDFLHSSIFGVDVALSFTFPAP